MASRKPTQSLSTQEIGEELDILSEGSVSDLEDNDSWEQDDVQESSFDERDANDEPEQDVGVDERSQESSFDERVTDEPEQDVGAVELSQDAGECSQYEASLYQTATNISLPILSPSLQSTPRMAEAEYMPPVVGGTYTQ